VLVALFLLNARGFSSTKLRVYPPLDTWGLARSGNVVKSPFDGKDVDVFLAAKASKE
jgi:hypothetical protein